MPRWRACGRRGTARREKDGASAPPSLRRRRERLVLDNLATASVAESCGRGTGGAAVGSRAAVQTAPRARTSPSRCSPRSSAPKAPAAGRPTPAERSAAPACTGGGAETRRGDGRTTAVSGFSSTARRSSACGAPRPRPRERHDGRPSRRGGRSPRSRRRDGRTAEPGGRPFGLASAARDGGRARGPTAREAAAP